ncbi:hypothetical protein HaLaN_32753, partial [Haematococcus lacustris]
MRTDCALLWWALLLGLAGRSSPAFTWERECVPYIRQLDIHCRSEIDQALAKLSLPVNRTW